MKIDLLEHLFFFDFSCIMIMSGDKGPVILYPFEGLNKFGLITLTRATHSLLGSIKEWPFEVPGVRRSLGGRKAKQFVRSVADLDTWRRLVLHWGEYIFGRTS